MRREIAATLRSVVRNRSSARCMRHSVRYLIGDRPNTSRNRWSSTDRETVTTLASAASAVSNEALAALSPRVKWQQSYVTDDKIFCVYVAEDQEVIREHARLASLP